MINFDLPEELTILKGKFKDKMVYFKEFQNLNQEEVEKIKKEVETFQAKFPNSKGKLDEYMRVLRYITSPKAHTYFQSFDHQALFLILAVDAQLESYKTYLRTDITSIKNISFLPIEIQKKYVEKRSKELKELTNKIQNKVGFYNSNLIEIEAAYYRKFLINNEIITGIQKDYYHRFLKLASKIKDFDDISKERLSKIELQALDLKQRAKEEMNINDIIFHMVENSSQLDLQNYKEQMLFLIIALDNNLDMLRIFTDECRTESLTKRCQEQFGFYNITLIKLEQLFHDTFREEQFISEWYQPKKKSSN